LGVLVNIICFVLFCCVSWSCAPPMVFLNGMHRIHDLCSSLDVNFCMYHPFGLKNQFHIMCISLCIVFSSSHILLHNMYKLVYHRNSIWRVFSSYKRKKEEIRTYWQNNPCLCWRLSNGELLALVISIKWDKRIHKLLERLTWLNLISRPGYLCEEDWVGNLFRSMI